MQIQGTHHSHPVLAAPAVDRRDLAAAVSTVTAPDDKDRATISDSARRRLAEEDRRLPNDLSDGEKQEVRELAQRDREVRAHEAAHKAAAAGLATGGATFTYQQGPDGRRYAIGGEVQVSAQPGRTAQEKLQNARQLRAAALAPSSPSAHDQQVAARAASMEAEARQELAEEQAETRGDESDGGSRAGHAQAPVGGVSTSEMRLRQMGVY